MFRIILVLMLFHGIGKSFPIPPSSNPWFQGQVLEMKNLPADASVALNNSETYQLLEKGYFDQQKIMGFDIKKNDPESWLELTLKPGFVTPKDYILKLYEPIKAESIIYFDQLRREMSSDQAYSITDSNQFNSIREEYWQQKALRQRLGLPVQSFGNYVADVFKMVIPDYKTYIETSIIPDKNIPRYYKNLSSFDIKDRADFEAVEDLLNRCRSERRPAMSRRKKFRYFNCRALEPIRTILWRFEQNAARSPEEDDGHFHCNNTSNQFFNQGFLGYLCLWYITNDTLVENLNTLNKDRESAGKLEKWTAGDLLVDKFNMYTSSMFSEMPKDDDDDSGDMEITTEKPDDFDPHSSIFKTTSRPTLLNDKNIGQLKIPEMYIRSTNPLPQDQLGLNFAQSTRIHLPDEYKIDFPRYPIQPISLPISSFKTPNIPIEPILQPWIHETPTLKIPTLEIPTVKLPTVKIPTLGWPRTLRG